MNMQSINEVAGSEDAITLISRRKIGLDFKRPSNIQKTLVLPFNHKILLWCIGTTLLMHNTISTIKIR